MRALVKRAATITLLAAATLTAGFLAGILTQPTASAQGFTVVLDCGASSTSQVRTTLYFGRARPKGSVSELEWQLFLRDEVTKRFPQGLTVWNAEGQWRTSDGNIEHEQSKVLLLVHPDTPAARQSVQSVIDAYRKVFEQDSVLWENARVCVAA